MRRQKCQKSGCHPLSLLQCRSKAQNKQDYTVTKIQVLANKDGKESAKAVERIECPICNMDITNFDVLAVAHILMLALSVTRVQTRRREATAKSTHLLLYLHWHEYHQRFKNSSRAPERRTAPRHQIYMYAAFVIKI